MKHIALIVLALTTVSAPALAQNADQIAAVKAGRSCIGCNLFQADFDYENISGRNLSRSRLRQADMTAAEADRSNFSRADLSIANMYGIRATGANFSGANLSQASLVGGYFAGANFTGANLSGADLSGIEARNARGLTQAQLNSACGDEATELPRGLRIRSCR